MKRKIPLKLRTPSTDHTEKKRSWAMEGGSEGRRRRTFEREILL